MRRVLAAAIVLLALALISCGGSGSGSTPSSPTPSSTTPPSAAVTITIVRQNGAQSFSPNPASAGGQMVVFRNADAILHRVRLNDASIDTGDLPPGATSRAVQMPAGGTNYHCSIHPDMIGAVNAASGAPPPTCQGPYCDD